MTMKNKTGLLLALILLFAVIPQVSAAVSDCSLGEVYVAGEGCLKPEIQVTKKTYTESGTQIGSSVGGGLDPIRIDNPFVAPGQPVLVELTISNVGAQYPFNLIPLPPEQYGFVVTIDPVDEILYKTGDGTYERYNINDVKWGSWFGSDWASKSWYYLRKGIADFKEVTGDDLCKYVEVGSLFPDFAKKRFLFDSYRNEMEERHGSLTEDNYQDKITDKDIEDYFPAVYEWECIRSLDRESFENEVKKDYCGDTLTMGCMAEYMNDNIGKLKTSSFVMLTNQVPEGTCQYSDDDGITYCGVGRDGICPPGTEGTCQGQSEYTFEFVMLVPADAPALSPQEFERLVNNGNIQGDFITDPATGEQYNFGFTSSAVCPGDDYSAGCHTLNVRVQPTNKAGLKQVFQKGISGAAFGGTGGAVLGGGIGAILGSIGGAIVGIVKGVMTYGDIELIGAPIYEGQGIFYVVSPALKVTATFTLYLAVLAGGSLAFVVGRRRK